MYKKRGLIGFLCNRELGKNTSFDCPTNISQVIAEEKSTIPIVNKACELSGPSRSTFLVAFSSDRSLIASTHGDHSVRVTEVKTGRCHHVLHGHPRTPWTIAFHPSSNDIIATGCLGGQVRIWDLRGGGCEVWKSEDGRVIASLAFHPTDQLLVIATMNEILFWDWSKSEPFAKSKTASSHERVRWCKFDPFGHYLYTGIANKSTIQSEDLPYSGTTNIELPTDSAGSSAEPGHLWDQYRRVVNEITAHQRERIQLQQGLLRDSNVDPMLQHDIDIIEPTSPQASALRMAQQYAARVTRQSFQPNASSRTPPVAPADRPLPPHIEIGRVEGPSAPDFGDTDEHMQQIHRIPNIYASNNNNPAPTAPPRGLDTLARAAETVSQMDSQAERGSTSPSVRWAGSSLFHQPNRERLLGYSMDINDNVTNLRNRMGMSRITLPTTTSSSLYRRSPFVPRYSGSALPSSPRMRSLRSFYHQAPRQSLTRRDSSAPRLSSPLTSSTLERVLNRNREEDITPLPSDLNLDFLSDIQVSLPNSGTPSSTPVTTSVSSSSLFNDFRFGQLGMETESEVESITSTVATTSDTNVSRESESRSSVSPVYVNSDMRTGQSPSELPLSRQSRPSIVRIPRSSSILLSRLSSNSPLETISSAITSRSPPVLSTTPAVPPSLILPETVRPTRTRVLPETLTTGRDAIDRAMQRLAAGRSSPCRDRSLMTLLEAPLPILPSILNQSASVTGTPQPVPPPEPVPPVTQSAFVGRNREVREALTRANEEATASSASRPHHSCPEQNCQVCGGYGSFLDSYNRRRAQQFPRHASPSILRYSRSLRGSALPRASLSFNPPISSSSATVSIVTPTPTSIITPIPTSAASGLSTSISDSTAAGSGAHQPQRLATIIETEVREAINRIRSHEVDLTHTLRDLDSLQRNLGVEQTPNADSPSEPAPESAPVPEADLGPAADGNSMETALEVTVENSPSDDQSPAGSDSTNEGLLAISNISSVLGERIQELDERVNSIQTRLRESMQALDRQSRYTRLDDIHSVRVQRARRLRERMNDRRLQRRQQRQELQSRARSREPGSTAAMQQRLQQIQQSAGAREQERRERRRQYQWHALRRRQLNLHRDYNVSVLDDTINRQDDLQAAINRTIAGAFIANGEASVASNIVTLTHRIQRWDLNRGIPDITDPDSNIIVRSCKLHNDATADISQDGRFLATFVSTSRGFPDDTVLGVFGLQPHNMGQCLYTKSFGPNAISLSISPLNNYVMVGLAAKRLQWVFAPKQMVAQIYKLKTVGAGEDSMEHICDLMHPCDLDLRVHVSVNSARWLPGVGEGVVYCTNRGDLHICKPGTESKSLPASESSDDRQQNYTRQLVMQLLRINSPRTNNSATQTSTQGVRRTASTQTDHVSLLSSDTDSD